MKKIKSNNSSENQWLASVAYSLIRQNRQIANNTIITYPLTSLQLNYISTV